MIGKPASTSRPKVLARRGLPLAALVMLGFLVSLVPAPARTEGPNSEPPPGVTPAVTIGVLEVVGASHGIEHFGIYSTLGFSATVPLHGPWAIIPSVGLEFSPEFGNWGGTFYLTLDRVIHEGRRVIVTLDPYVGLIHDAAPDGSGDFEHSFLAGAGVGPSFVIGRTTLSPSVGVYANLETGDVVVSPTLLFSVSF